MNDAHLRGRTLAGIAAALLAFGNNAYAATSQTVHVSEIESPLGCVETVVTKAVAPTGTSMADGGGMDFRDNIAPGHGTQAEQIRSVYIAPGDYPVARAGDRVRVCLISMPKKQDGCDPAKDIRGREFLVYDRTSQSESSNAAVYSNGEHDCGGA